MYQRRLTTESKRSAEMREKRLEERRMESIREDEKGLFKTKSVFIMANPELYMNVNNAQTWRIVAGVWLIIGSMGLWFYWGDESEKARNLSTKAGTVGPRRPDGNV
jgi:hypothetical protein